MLKRPLIQEFFVDESGVTAIEYALLASLIAVAIATTVTVVGVNLNGLYEMVRDEVQEVVGG